MAKRATRLLTVLSLIIVTIGCDRVTKGIAAHSLAGRPRLSLASDCIRLEYSENQGGFLSLGAGWPHAARTAVFGLGTFLVLGILGIWILRGAIAGHGVLGPTLLWAGGVANLVDRLVQGRVVDFLNLGVGAVRTGIFNVADVAIMAASVLIITELAKSRSASSSGGSARRRTRG